MSNMDSRENRQKIQDSMWQGIMASKIPQERERLLHAHWQFMRQRMQKIKTLGR